ncbi:hypothetical protein LPLAFNJD_LOCUS4461 [Methylorubrum aminovorans]|nr:MULTISPECIES: SMR family transporter [unclassified Methylobacterium]QIJ76008.1 hypothetical protein CLZ_16155 [Methylobacterium sp. CLZ]QIJ80910.1 hypothetical protein GU700_16160 [Methylobacterium sp. NI91]
MTVSTSVYAALGAPIAFEVAGTTLLQKSEQSARIGPTLGMAACYTAAFFLMSVALNAMPLGVVYVEAILADPVVERRNWAALYLSALADPDVRRVDRRRLERHRATDGAPTLEVVRLAVDGAWHAWPPAHVERAAPGPCGPARASPRAGAARLRACRPR